MNNLDLKKTISDLRFVSKVYIVGVNNGVKEVLFSLNKQSNNDIKIKCIDLSNRELDFEFCIDDINNKKNDDNSEVLNYLYEPNSMILKSGAFGLICDRYDVKKLNTNTQYSLIKDYCYNSKYNNFVLNLYTTGVCQYIKINEGIWHDVRPDSGNLYHIYTYYENVLGIEYILKNF